MQKLPNRTAWRITVVHRTEAIINTAHYISPVTLLTEQLRLKVVAISYFEMLLFLYSKKGY